MHSLETWRYSLELMTVLLCQVSSERRRLENEMQTGYLTESEEVGSSFRRLYDHLLAFILYTKLSEREWRQQ